VVLRVMSGRNLSPHCVRTTCDGCPHLAEGQRSSMTFMISSAQRTASAIALTVAGTLFPPSNCASLRAARILAAINSRRLRPSSTLCSLSHSPFIRRHTRSWLGKLHLWSTPVAFPFCGTYDVPWQSSAACKGLKVLKTTVLKRLASAVQLRPWPPHHNFNNLLPILNPMPLPLRAEDST
jgi:hypothetical protein